MKKFFLLMVVAIASTMFVACGDEPERPTGEISKYQAEAKSKDQTIAIMASDTAFEVVSILNANDYVVAGVIPSDTLAAYGMSVSDFGTTMINYYYKEEKLSEILYSSNYLYMPFSSLKPNTKYTGFAVRMATDKEGFLDYANEYISIEFTTPKAGAKAPARVAANPFSFIPALHK